MTEAEPTPPAGRPDPLSTHRAPPTYQAPGLIPPGGPARTWGLVVIATPLLLAVLIALIGGLSGGSSGSSSGTSGTGYDSGLFGSGTSGSGTSGSGGGTAGTDDQPAYADPTTASAWPYGDTDTPGASATDGSYGDPADTATATATPSSTPTGPGDVVTAYFAAISSHDYRTAWDLGGKNLDSDYDSFVSGYATTEQDTVTVESVTGDQAQVTIEALQTDGTTKSYDATYTVQDGVITSGTATQTG
ncbi:hypothetical protein [Streptomyces sp. NPDC086777]|uniref:hypothetical protein n=1 Tax=Streptomyces sp. NPDC086777 TaxID=3154866 RepID=UPI00344B963F